MFRCMIACWKSARNRFDSAGVTKLSTARGTGTINAVIREKRRGWSTLKKSLTA